MNKTTCGKLSTKLNFPLLSPLQRSNMHRKSDTMAMDVTQLADFQLDPNNNQTVETVHLVKKNEKYSLRQRHKRIEPVSVAVVSKKQSGAIAKSHDHHHKHVKSNTFLAGLDIHGMCSPLSPTSSIASSSSSGDSRPRSTAAGKPAKEKPKTKAAPLSKYRRKTANARERTRMREINSAFENLRKCVPITMGLNNNSPQAAPIIVQPQPQMASPTNEKLTKITTLRLAMKYIKVLTEALDNPSAMDSLSDYSSESLDLPSCLIDSNNNSCSSTQSTSSLNTMLNITVPTASNFNSCIDPSKLLLSTVNCPPKPKVSHYKPSSYSSMVQSSTRFTHQNRNELLFGSPCLTPPIDDSSSSDLALLLESSDAESHHHLSEPCLSPPLSGQNIKISFNSSNCHDDDNPLELGLLLESDTDSLQLSEPCLSPLGTVLDPFSELLSTGFTEQTVLDMYL